MSHFREVLEEVRAPGDDYIDSLASSRSSFDELVLALEKWGQLPEAFGRWVGNASSSGIPLPEYMMREIQEKQMRLRKLNPDAEVNPSAAGARVLCAILIYIRRFELLGTAADACITDLFEMLTDCLDLLTLPDAKLIVDMLWDWQNLLKPLFDEGDHAMKTYMADENIPIDLRNKFKQRIVPGRAMFICVCNGLINILKTDVTDYLYQSQIRMLPYLILPESFEGMTNRHRGKEPPAISRLFSARVASIDEEKNHYQDWLKAIEYRKLLNLTIVPSITFNSFILLRRALAFLHDPGEYMAQCVASGGVIPCKIEDLHLNPSSATIITEDALEEGEAVDDRQAPGGVGSVNKSTDLLCRRFRELEQLGLFLQKKVRTKDARKRASRLDISLISFCASPHSYIELFTELPQIAATLATNIIIALKLHFQWPYGSEASDVSLLSGWSTHIAVSAVYAYRRALQALLPCVSTELLEESNEALGLELQSLTTKFENIRIPRVASNFVEPKLPEVQEPATEEMPDSESNARLEAFLSKGLDRINVISATSVEDLKSISLAPADLTSWRSGAYIETPLPNDYDSRTHEGRLAQRWADAKAKQKIDEDEQNEIDESDRFQSSQLNCWRTLRCLALAGIAPVYSYPPAEPNDLCVFLKMYD